MTEFTEFASADRGVGGPYESLAKWAGVPLSTVAEHATAGTLGRLVEQRQLTGPLSGREALRLIEAKKYGPREKPSSPAARLGELRARRLCWAIENEEARRRREPDWLLGELLAKKVGP
jgi:hypothetical protein